DQAPWKVGAVVLLMLAILGVMLVRAKQTRVFVFIPWALALCVAAWLLAETSPSERQLVVASTVLSVCETAVVAAVATLFASFSSPFLTAMFTGCVFVIGRSADSMAHFPPRVFGPTWAACLHGLAHVVPNLHVYVPARALLLGRVPGQEVWPYVGSAA